MFVSVYVCVGNGTYLPRTTWPRRARCPGHWRRSSEPNGGGYHTPPPSAASRGFLWLVPGKRPSGRVRPDWRAPVRADGPPGNGSPVEPGTSASPWCWCFWRSSSISGGVVGDEGEVVSEEIVTEFYLLLLLLHSRVGPLAWQEFPADEGHGCSSPDRTWDRTASDKLWLSSARIM